MKWHRIWAMVVRHLYLFIHSWDHLVDAFYWSSMEILLWGLTSLWIRSETHIPNLVTVLLTGLVFWQIVSRSQYEFSINFLVEIWSKNFISLFASPLKDIEWIVSVIILGIIKMMLSTVYLFGLVWLLYAIKIWSGGVNLIPAGILLLMNGWWIGLFVAGLLIRFGTKIQAVAYTSYMLMAPFSAVYYPISVLPKWGQYIAWWVPTSHIFTYMRSVVSGEALPISALLLPLLLTTIYVVLAVWWFVASMNASRKISLARLEQ